MSDIQILYSFWFPGFGFGNGDNCKEKGTFGSSIVTLAIFRPGIKRDMIFYLSLPLSHDSLIKQSRQGLLKGLGVTKPCFRLGGIFNSVDHRETGRDATLFASWTLQMENCVGNKTRLGRLMEHLSIPFETGCQKYIRPI